MFRVALIERLLLLISLTLLCMGASNVAAAALVEDINGSVTGIGIMQYVTSGTVLRLGSKSRITLGYLHSCIQEVITGGVVTIGANQSSVKQGKILRQHVECDGGQRPNLARN